MELFPVMLLPTQDFRTHVPVARTDLGQTRFLCPAADNPRKNYCKKKIIFKYVLGVPTDRSDSTEMEPTHNSTLS